MMKPIRSRLARWFAALGLALLVMPSLAADPPSRIGRLAEVAGQVWIYDDTAGEWIAAMRNRPITSGDRLSTERGARAEVQVGSVVWRLDANTEIEVLQLDDGAIRLQLHSGSVALRVRNREAAREVEVLTAEGRFAPQRSGHFRIDRDDDVSAATAWSGTLNFRSDDSELDIAAGQRTEFWRDGGRTHFSRLGLARDAFADWAIAEDARANERSASSRYVSPEMPGADDLDRNGRWERSSEYGSLWVPYSVAPDWAPYRYGQWAWVNPWGWSWVDDAPWGFAPFHYGRWLHQGGRWCWAPGSYVARPVYAPALVAWIGGPRVSLSLNIGSPAAVGWFPLGPHEVYVPTYRVSPVYIRNVNVTHVTNVPPTFIHQPTMAAQQTRYVNRQVQNAVTAVAPDVINRRQPVAPHVDPRVVREIEREPVSVSLPVAALAVRRDAIAPSPVAPRVLPPAPNRLAAVPADAGSAAIAPEPRVLRSRGSERAEQAQRVPPPAAMPADAGSAAIAPEPRLAVPVAPAQQPVVVPRSTTIVPQREAARAALPHERGGRAAQQAQPHVEPPQRAVVTPIPRPAVEPSRPAPPPQQQALVNAIAPHPVAPPAATRSIAAPPVVVRPVAPAVPAARPPVAGVQPEPESPARHGGGERPAPSRNNSSRENYR